MCGIVGFFNSSNFHSENQVKNIISSMTQILSHRGPDDSGTWVDSKNQVALGHRRLSILDLSPFGHQPMISSSNKFIIVFNGEIYNHDSLRLEILKENSSIQFRGHSDTEVLLSGFEFLGIEKTIEYCHGMFAFALFDVEKHELVLGRDRFGEKPLYYGWQGEGKNKTFLFASELKALKKHPAFENKIDLESLSQYFSHDYVPAPHSIYKGIFKLKPGSILRVSLKNNKLSFFTYWSASKIIIEAKKDLYTGSVSNATNDLKSLLLKTISNQMLADVPIGAFLSGGIDSSLIVALMQEISSKPIRTFTVGFEDKSFNEANFAKTISQHLKTNHSELYVSNKDIYESISMMPNLYDEPFADSSQIPTFLVSRLAQVSVKVALSGDGGDELFGGYNRYLFAEKYWPFFRSHPKLLKQGLSFAFKHAPDNLIGLILGSFSSDFKKEIFRSKIDKSKSLLNAQDIESLYLSFTVNLENIDFLNKDHIYSGRNNSSRVNDLEINSLDDSEYMMAEDSIGYLPDSILTKLDRSAMSVSLESRIPFLDHEIFKFAWTLPKEYKIHKHDTKVILKSLLKQYLPETMFDRPKSGFGIPLDEWLRGPLLNWADSYLNSNILNNGYLNVDNILGKWNEHKKRRKNWGNALWTVLMFQVWLESNQL